MPTAVIWFRDDLRLQDHPGLQAAHRAGFAPLPVYIHAPDEEGGWAPGAASNAWRHRSLAALDAALQRLHQALGKWHDGEIAKAHLREFAAECAAPLSPADTAAHDKLLLNIRAEQAAHLATFHAEWHAFLAANVPNQFNSKDR